VVSIACRVREICQHEFTHANQIHEIWLLQGPIAPNLMGLSPMIWLFSESTDTGLSSGADPVFIATCVPALQALESDHLEKLQARPEFTAFSHKDGSTSNSLESCADS